MRVSNLESPRSGRPVANQFIVNYDGGELFQSYQTPIAKRKGSHITISRDYNYSVTTGRYFNQWLRDNGLSGAEIDELKKWLKKADFGNQLVSGFNYHYVEEL